MSFEVEYGNVIRWWTILWLNSSIECHINYTIHHWKAAFVTWVAVHEISQRLTYNSLCPCTIISIVTWAGQGHQNTHIWSTRGRTVFHYPNDYLNRIAPPTTIRLPLWCFVPESYRYRIRQLPSIARKQECWWHAFFLPFINKKDGRSIEGHIESYQITLEPRIDPIPITFSIAPPPQPDIGTLTTEWPTKSQIPP